MLRLNQHTSTANSHEQESTQQGGIRVEGLGGAGIRTSNGRVELPDAQNCPSTTPLAVTPP